MLDALAVYDDPAVHDPVDGVGVLPWRALRVEALLGVGRTDEAQAALAELEERVARRPAGLVGAGGGPVAVRDRRDASGSAPRCAGRTTGRWRSRRRCPPS